MSNKIEDDHSSFGSISPSPISNKPDWLVWDSLRGRPYQPGQLGQAEIWWAERQEALEAACYMLRPRHCQRWTGSWSEITGKKGFDYWNCEECQPQMYTSCFHEITLTTLSAGSWMRPGYLTGNCADAETEALGRQPLPVLVGCRGSGSFFFRPWPCVAPGCSCHGVGKDEVGLVQI
jgi:hypothetical protein